MPPRGIRHRIFESRHPLNGGDAELGTTPEAVLIILTTGVFVAKSAGTSGQREVGAIVHQAADLRQSIQREPERQERPDPQPPRLEGHVFLSQA